MKLEEEEMHKDVRKGALKLISLVEKTSKKEPYLAIAQLLIAAVALGRMVKLSDDELRTVFKNALDDVFNPESLKTH